METKTLQRPEQDCGLGGRRTREALQHSLWEGGGESAGDGEEDPWAAARDQLR